MSKEVHLLTKEELQARVDELMMKDSLDLTELVELGLRYAFLKVRADGVDHED